MLQAFQKSPESIVASFIPFHQTWSKNIQDAYKSLGLLQMAKSFWVPLPRLDGEFQIIAGIEWNWRVNNAAQVIPAIPILFPEVNDFAYPAIYQNMEKL